jgi:hypothetical protein
MPQEAKVLSDKAKANGMNEAEYIRLLISQKPNDYPEVRKLLKELINEVNRIGININQIVFNSNAQIYSKKDKEQLVAYMKKLNQSVSEAVAISKILHMKDSGNSFHARHLKRALDYVMNPEKTQGGRLVGAINCQADMAFEQMMDTKKKFGKTDKRQGYHIILSFKEDEVEPDRAFEITQKFVAEYLGDAYEAVFVVHDNTDHVHSHIVFNSVSFVDGKKYRYEKGDWAKYIQPITNKLCQEYGLSIIDVEDGSKEKQHENYKDWSEYREGSFVWADMIKRDLDACILQANDFSGFLELLSEKGYEVKQGKYLAVRPQGMTRFRRCKTLGENYSQEAIVERIAKEDLSFYQSQNEERQAAIVKCYVKRYRRAKMSGLQKRYYAKLYRIGKLKKKPYSQVWKYRDDIRKMHKLQEQYLFLVRHKIESAEELVSVLDNLTDKKKEASKEKSKTYKAKERFKDIFDKAEQIRELNDAESCYQSGDTFFEDEHNAWERLNTELLAQGYSVEEVESLRKKYESKYAQDCKAERAVSKELSLGRSIWKELTVSASAEEKQYDKETIRDRKEQPIR